jgi:hypothetical protein|tara:strand:+ start:2079 stop:2405 length:327 start_codon:yes stop_codon:yes gene_type:complete
MADAVGELEAIVRSVEALQREGETVAERFDLVVREVERAEAREGREARCRVELVPRDIKVRNLGWQNALAIRLYGLLKSADQTIQVAQLARVAGDDRPSLRRSHCPKR